MAKKLTKNGKGYGHGVGHLDGGNSGRYPWGSGDKPYQHASDFLTSYRKARHEGQTQKDFATGHGMTINELRAAVSIARDETNLEIVAEAQRLLDQGLTKTEVAKRLGLKGESSLRDMLKPERQERRGASKMVADVIKKAVDEKGLIDVGAGNEQELGVTETTLAHAVERLRMEGYEYFNNIKFVQLGTNKQTTMKILAKPGTEWKEAFDKRHEIESIADYDTGIEKTKLNIKPPVSFDSKRLMVRHYEEGGSEKDGVIELRRGVPDISLGQSSYAQVRIAVDGTHYIKGMAMYGQDKDFPPGVDIIVNSHKSVGTPLKGSGDRTVLKPLKSDPDNPFGATISKQLTYIDSKGIEKQSVINKVNDEGTWADWSKTVASQMLGKQPLKLIKSQLDLTYAQMAEEFEEIKSVTNPTVKRKLLELYADQCDSAAVELKATSFPRQSQCVILPVTSLKNNEIYAPQYENGETLALIRYPHGALFEIPILKVNNNNKEGKSNIGKPIDAVGISPNTAQILSGADFDGDTVTVIPCNSPKSKVKIQNIDRDKYASLKALEGFDPQVEFPHRDGARIMPKSNLQKQMGSISNLITDMTLKGAGMDELARAVAHSMVIVDSPKHELDYKLSEKYYKIDELKKTYQQHRNDDGYGGASTLLSSAKSTVLIDERSSRPPKIDPKTGRKMLEANKTGRTYFDKRSGTYKKAMQESTRMYETEDAYTLSSGTEKENTYAAYANKVKALGNKARLELLNTGSLEYSPAAAKTYAHEVESLNANLAVALKNAPRERQAQRTANQVVAIKIKENDLDPRADKEEIKKLKNQALAASRARYGAKKQSIKITEKEWEAIQAGAIHDTKLVKILNNADLDAFRELATPKENKTKISAAKIRLMKSYAATYTVKEIAEMMGLSASTVSKYLNGKE